jgi:hypothetical protein
MAAALRRANSPGSVIPTPEAFFEVDIVGVAQQSKEGVAQQSKEGVVWESKEWCGGRRSGAVVKGVVRRSRGSGRFVAVVRRV